MKRKSIRRLLSIMLVAVIFTGCGKANPGAGDHEDGKVFKIGVTQLLKHAALDAAYEGFVDALKEGGYEEGKNIVIDYQNAHGDMSNTNTIASKLVNDNSDLILAISTPSAQAVANATKDIPVLVTAVTDPAASGLVSSNEEPKGNISGTSDLTPVSKQIELLVKLLPETKKIAILYCSSEDNSKIQAELAITAAAEYGIEAIEATVSNSNEIEQVVQSLVGKVDAIYAPTDNVIANGMPTVALVANPNKIPVICGEEGMLEKGGFATYGIDYYKLGKMTGVQAIKILEGKTTTDKMPIEYLPDAEFSVRINEEVRENLGIVIPDDFTIE